MIKLKLNNRTFKLPARYTIEQWKQVVRMDLEEPSNWPKIIGVALNRHWYEFAKVEEDGLILGSSLVVHDMGKRRASKHIDFTQISFGQFIDLDVMLIRGMEKHIDDILDIISKEPIKYIDEALWMIDQYCNFRISTYRAYAGLFGLNQQGEQEDVEPEDHDPNKIAKGWYKVIVDLADDDLQKLDAVTDTPLKKALNFMSLRKERLLEENAKQLQQKQRHDLQRNNR